MSGSPANAAGEQWAAAWMEWGSAMLTAAARVLQGQELLGVDAETVVSQVFLEMMQKGPPPTDRPPGPHLIAAARNRATDAVRRHTRHHDAYAPDPDTVSAGGGDQADRVAEADLAARAVVAVGHLPPKQRHVMKERVMKQRPAKDVAAEINVTPQRIPQLITEAITALRRHPAFIDLLPDDLRSGGAAARPRRQRP
jgi:RNA polymerase sigma factor (sigma-70 family)